MGLLGLCLKSRMIGKVTSAKSDTTIRRMGHERKRSRDKGKPLGGAPIKVTALGEIFLGEGHLASSTGYAARPAAASPSACSTKAAFQKGTRGLACAGKWRQPDGSGISQREPEAVSRISWQKMECLVAQMLLSCLLSSYGWDFGKEGF